MPYYRKKRYSKGRSAGKRKGRPTGRSFRAKRGGRVRKNGSSWKNPIPIAGKFKFTFSDSGYSLHPTAVLYQQSAVFSGNSPYDPDVSGGGVQPYGFDNYFGANAPYQRYQVYASKIKIFPAVASGDTEAEMRNIRIAVVPSQETALSYIDYNDLLRTPGAKGMVIRSQDTTRMLQAYRSSKKIWPIAGNEYETTGTYGGNPDRRWYWHVFVDTTMLSADITLYYDVKITYYLKGIRLTSINES